MELEVLAAIGAAPRTSPAGVEEEVLRVIHVMPTSFRAGRRQLSPAKPEDVQDGEDAGPPDAPPERRGP